MIRDDLQFQISDFGFRIFHQSPLVPSREVRVGGIPHSGSAVVG
jgi:hypothetical protein